MRQAMAAIGLAALVAGCGGGARPASIATRPVALPAAGLERVMGQDAGALTRLFGQPDADVREGPGRKMQFVGRFCVLDAYLYPKGSGEPRVSWVDAREPDGSGIDRASCVAALTRRDGGIAARPLAIKQLSCAAADPHDGAMTRVPASPAPRPDAARSGHDDRTWTSGKGRSVQVRVPTIA